MTLKELLEKLKLAAQARKPVPFETNGMKEKGVPIHD
ncbi:hypothetical protein UFOVP263_2 [uncultured Caudovirales phage]|uniref:Uncharacterized protein n=1 Tax=uncultured Caudovirales phage TaxID=2100421 RepID=A0A6J5LHY1_9CAUD|nr:hypothetical protein UFOVP263_2 [uncultured Caudovirales phage]CAB4241985.1 hypothetical protein UFOVP91_2 [uncultured Caudovirales phage]